MPGADVPPVLGGSAGFGAAAVAAAYAGSFAVPYYVAAVFDLIAAILALFALRPLVRSRIAREATGEVKKGVRDC